MLDFAALPPEINSGLMYAGPGAAPMMAASVAWDILATELYSAASSYGTAIADLGTVWLGPSSTAMTAAATPYVAWISATAGQVEATATQAKAAAAAYEAAFAMTVPPPVIVANRVLLMALIATNFFGQNTPAIMATEAHYMEMWAQDAAAMYGYQAAAQVASTFTPFTAPLQTTNAAGLASQTAAVGQAAGTSAGTSAQTVAPLTSAVSTPLSPAVAAPNGVTTFVTTATASSSSPTTSQLSSLSSLTSSSTAVTSGAGLASGAGPSASLATSGIAMLTSMSGLMQSASPAAGVFSGHVFGSALGGGFGSGTGMLGSTGMGSTAVSAGVGRAASIGMLSVPQTWTSAAPAFSQVGSAWSGAGATPAVAPGGAGGVPAGMPMLANAAQRAGAPMASTPRLGFRPAMVQYPVGVG